jgi:glycosyltransferase involved in cell wall biosynthesis
MKKVLIIAYYWPPAGGPGVQRWLKLTKYLARQDVQCFVLTVDPEKATYPLRDESLLADIDSNVKVFSTDTSEMFGAYKKASGRKDVPFSGFAGEGERVSLKQKVARFARGNFFIPDPRKGWNKHAYQKAEELIREENIKTVITSSPPHSSQLIGRKLKRKLGIHWIADFRDPWTDIYYYDLFYPTPIARAYDKSLEKSVLIESDEIISVTQSWKELYVSKSPKIKAEKIHVIPNGYDPDDFNATQKNLDWQDILITYAGTITQQYPLDLFLQACELSGLNIRLRLIGKWDNKTRQILEQASSADHFAAEFIDYIPKVELNKYLVNTDAQLFVLPRAESNKGHVSGKLLDYIGAENPVIGIGPSDGDAARILRETRIGKMFDYGGSLEELRDFLIQISKREKPALTAEAKDFARDAQARRVAALIQS